MSDPDQADPVERSDRAGLQDRAMRGASWTLIHVMVSLPVAFVANLVVARILGVEGYGRLAFLMTFMTVAGGIVTLGLGIGPAAVRRPCARRRPHRGRPQSAVQEPGLPAAGRRRRCSRSGCCSSPTSRPRC